MENENQKELQLLSSPFSRPPPPPPSSPSKILSIPSDFRILPHDHRHENDGPYNNNIHNNEGRPSLDLQLSISLRPIQGPRKGSISDIKGVTAATTATNNAAADPNSCIEALQWQAAEQIRLAAIEKAYAERVRELTRREMELAQSEFARARHMWERARVEVEKAERMKERATRQIDSTCMEITCQSCRQRFRP